MADEEVVYEDMTVEELRDELRVRGLAVGGNKDELVARLDEDDAEEGGTPVEESEEPDSEVISQALALEEPLKAYAASLDHGDNIDALKAAVRNAAHGIAHIRKAQDQMARLAER